jgi:5-methylcytosine-specific restriction endonuclease McrA
MQNALLLDRNYMAISVVPWQRAIKLTVKGKAEVVSEGQAEVTSGSGKRFKIPSIIRLLTVVPFRAYNGRLRFNRKNVLIRDGFECQYCSKHLGKLSGTIDHIIPRSRGGASDYLNCIACCKECNNIKGDRTPEEAKLKLKKVPKKPSFLTLYKHYMKNSPQEWSDYIIGL